MRRFAVTFVTFDGLNEKADDAHAHICRWTEIEKQ